MNTNTYLDIMGQRRPRPEGANEKEAFNELMRAEAEAIAAKLPELVMPMIDERAEELFKVMPESMKQPDPVTRDVVDEKTLRNMFAGYVANKLGLGFGVLRK
ncbi:TPA: hypothetical protein NPY76_004683 [Escherichia coli]|nr:hypothetical protein [Escherichia coli]